MTLEPPKGPPEQEPGQDHFQFSSPNTPKPSWGFWFPWLLFAPRKFFRQFGTQPLPTLRLAATYLLGVTFGISWVERWLSWEDFLTFSLPFPDRILHGWVGFWGFCLGIGFLAAFAYHTLGIWWYRQRLKWCGVAFPNIELSRNVYFFSSLACSLPYIIFVISQNLQYPQPKAGLECEIFAAALNITLFWALFVSFMGIQTLFPVKEGAARLWFLLLPSLFFGLGATTHIGPIFFGDYAEVPDLQRPSSYVLKRCEVKYPGNWRANAEVADSPGLTYLTIEAPVTNAFVKFIFFSREIRENHAAQEIARKLFQEKCSEEITAGNWGGFQGFGTTCRTEENGVPFRVRVFVAEAERSFAVIEVAKEVVYPKVEGAFSFIEDHFKVLPKRKKWPGTGTHNE